VGQSNGGYKVRESTPKHSEKWWFRWRECPQSLTNWTINKHFQKKNNPQITLLPDIENDSFFQKGSPFPGGIFRFHVKLQGCIYLGKFIATKWWLNVRECPKNPLDSGSGMMILENSAPPGM